MPRKKKGHPISRLRKESADRIARRKPGATSSSGNSDSEATPKTQKRPQKRALSKELSQDKEHGSLSGLEKSHERSVRRRSNTPSGKEEMEMIARRTPAITPFRAPVVRSVRRSRLFVSNPLKNQKASLVEGWRREMSDFMRWTWKVVYASSFENFKYRSTNLRKAYENTLKTRLLENVAALSLTVSITPSSCLNMNPLVDDAVVIKVEAVVPGDKEEDDRQYTVYTAWLFKHRMPQSRANKGLLWFPIIFYKGREGYHHVVVNWLQRSFGCYITHRGFSHMMGMWMVGISSGQNCGLKEHSNEDDTTTSVQMVYCVEPFKGLKNLPAPNHRKKPIINISFLPSDVSSAWKLFVNDPDAVTFQEMQTFNCCILGAVEEITLIPQKLFSLIRFKNSCLGFSLDGKVRIMCKKGVKVVLENLLELFLHTVYSNVFQDFIHKKSDKGETTQDEIISDEELDS
ncbi:centromere protein L-like isoform X2 [Oratosquilla oratoria]|uniref:centromere protein L-like isoform X2 n=1 Tax=Oratosquilla oratoria TaxID=337810 RepID=UPI003F777CBA